MIATPKASERTNPRRRAAASILVVTVFLATPWMASGSAGTLPALERLAAPLVGQVRHALSPTEMVDQAARSIAGPNTPALAPLVRPLTSSMNWTQVTTPTPTNSYEVAFTYDVADKAYVLFGGRTSVGLTAAAWTYSLSGVWTPLPAAGGPSARVGAQMAYDGADHYVVLFGGAGTSLFSDTWKFVGGKWTKLSPAAHPPATEYGSMTYDAAAGYVLLFGGLNSTGVTTGSTWSYKAGIWTKLAPTNAPSSRYGAQFAYDAADGYPVLFGGETATFATPADTWNYSAGNWHRLATPLTPKGRSFGAMAYDPSDAKVVLSTGYNASTGSVLSDTWAFSGGAWSKKATTYNPTARYLDAAADGTNSTGMLLYAGFSRVGLVTDVWSFKKSDWTPVHPAAPAPRYYDQLAWDAADRYVVLFGGYSASGVVLGDTWKFSGGVWTPLHPKVAPTPIFDGAMTWDGTDGYVLLFGGSNVGYLSGTWSFAKGAWTEVVSAAGSEPAPRDGDSLAYDAQDGYVVLYGGYNYSNPYNNGVYQDTWTYSGGVWALDAAVYFTGPGPRYEAEMSYDSADGVVVLFAGYNNVTTILDDTWEFTNGTWNNVTYAAGHPIGTVGAGMVDDPYDGYVILFGGYNVSWGTIYYAYTFSGGSWGYLPVSAFPPGDNLFVMAYDPALPGAVLYGGLNATGVISGETWTLTS